jgi:hypothetical protein
MPVSFCSALTRIDLLTYKGRAAVWRRPGLLWQNSPGVSLSVVVCLRVLAHTGMADCMRSCASYPLAIGPSAMSILRIAHWRGESGMIKWQCARNFWNSEVVIIFGEAARYRRAKVTRGHDNARSGNSKPHTWGKLIPIPALW